MKIVFLPQSSIPIEAHTLEQRPLGGIETGIIRLAQALEQIGAKAIVVTSVENPKLSSPLYVPLRAIQDIGPIDAFVSVREWKPLFVPLQAKKRFLWTGDSYDQPQTMGIGDRRISRQTDGLLLVSEWHREQICSRSHFPKEKSWVLRNGIDLSLFQGTETRTRKRLIYSSTPYRGLQFLPTLFSRIREKHPDSELHVFSGMAVYRGVHGENDAHLNHAEKEYRQIAAQLEPIPGVTLHGNVKQSDLAREFMRSSILAYPNTFEETSCITALEAQAGGCAIVSSARGALPETVGDSGILIAGEPGTPAYDDAFVAGVDRLFSDDQLFENLSARALAQAQGNDWRVRAQEFLEYLGREHALRI